MIKVDGIELSRNEYQGACYNYMSHTKKQELTDDDKFMVANQLVDTFLLLSQGRNGVYEPAELEVEESFKKLIEQFPSEEQFEATLKEMGDSAEVVKDRLKDDMILKAYIEGEFYSKISISDVEIERFYKENEDKFISPEQIKASHILVKEESVITDLNKKLIEGESFEELAKEHSECPSGQNGGDLGFFGKGKMVPEFETVAFALGLNEVSEPFKSDFGYHIVKVTEKSSGGKQSLSDVHDSIKQHLEQVEAQRVISEKVKSLRSKATVEIDRDSL